MKFWCNLLPSYYCLSSISKTRAQYSHSNFILTYEIENAASFGRISFFLFLVFLFIQVFTSIAVFNILITPLNAFPWVLNGLMEAWVSLRRVQRFLDLPELRWADYYRTPSSSSAPLLCRMPFQSFLCFR